MAIRLDGSTDAVYRLASLPAATPITVALWFYIEVDTNAAAVLWQLANATATQVEGLSLASADGTTPVINIDSANAGTATSRTTGVWYYIAHTRNGASHTLYLGDESTLATSAATASNNNTLTTPAGLLFGGTTAGAALNGRLAYIRVWTAALSEAEIQAEQYSTTAVRSTSLHADWPLPAGGSRLTDFSGNGRTLSASGTLADADDPVLPAIVSTARVETGVYTGDGTSSHGITGVGFQPDAVFVRRATASATVVRLASMDAGYSKSFSASDAQATNGVTSLDADGFTVSNSSNVNASGQTYYWIAVKAAAGAVELLSWTGNGTARTISGLTMTPAYGWVFPETAGNVNFRHTQMPVNTSVQAAAGVSQTTALTGFVSGGITVGTGEANASGVQYHGVFFAATDHSAAKSYVGNSTARTITGVGFDPEFVHTPSLDNYASYRTNEMPSGSGGYFGTQWGIDTAGLKTFVTDGFTMGTDFGVNRSGVTYYYVALSDAPVLTTTHRGAASATQAQTASSAATVRRRSSAAAAQGQASSSAATVRHRATAGGAQAATASTTATVRRQATAGATQEQAATSAGTVRHRASSSGTQAQTGSAVATVGSATVQQGSAGASQGQAASASATVRRRATASGVQDAAAATIAYVRHRASASASQGQTGSAEATVTSADRIQGTASASQSQTGSAQARVRHPATASAAQGMETSSAALVRHRGVSSATQAALAVTAGYVRHQATASATQAAFGSAAATVGTELPVVFIPQPTHVTLAHDGQTSVVLASGGLTTATLVYDGSTDVEVA